MNSMFAVAELFNCDLSKWDVSRVNDMSGMFLGAASCSGTQIRRGAREGRLLGTCEHLLQRALELGRALEPAQRRRLQAARLLLAVAHAVPCPFNGFGDSLLEPIYIAIPR